VIIDIVENGDYFAGNTSPVNGAAKFWCSFTPSYLQLRHGMQRLFCSENRNDNVNHNEDDNESSCSVGMRGYFAARIATTTTRTTYYVGNYNGDNKNDDRVKLSMMMETMVVGRKSY
jgi:hypothetical protein